MKRKFKKKKKITFFSVLSEVQNNRKRIFKSRGEKKRCLKVKNGSPSNDKNKKTDA